MILNDQISNNNSDNDASGGGILDAILETEHAHALADFNPEDSASELLALLRDREREILAMRYGLKSYPQHTLEGIGKKLGLTRERVRQVEKESLRRLRAQTHPETVKRSAEIIKRIIEDHGGIFAEHALADHLLVADKSEKKINAMLFLLELFDEFNNLPESSNFHRAWHIGGFDFKKLDLFHETVISHFKQAGEPKDLETLKSFFASHENFADHKEYFQDKVVENLLRIIKQISSNPFGHYGLVTWRVIKPRDVGDKAYLVLKHYGKPEHYTKITEKINEHVFDDRTAYKETVHNELIMDTRFVLVGRGIYALTEWGYQKGVVTDVIKAVLAEFGEPITRNKIIDEVMKRRIVKRNTILVGLANKKHFRKIGKDKFSLV